MALELEGRIAQKLPVQQGTSARGAWAKQEFIFEYQEGNFPTSLCMNVWGTDKVKELERFQVGDKVKVSLRFKGREVRFIEKGKETILKFVSMLEEGRLDKEPKLEGRFLNVIVLPKDIKK